MNEKYVYVVGYGTCEESEYDYLMHKEKLSKEQLREMVETSVVFVVKKMKKDKYSYIHNYEDVHGEVVEYLIKNYGFKKLEIEGRWNVFGWGSMFVNDWEGYTETDEELKHLRERMKKEGFTVEDDDYLKSDEK